MEDTSSPVSFYFVLVVAVAVLGFALARRRLLCGFLVLLSYAIRPIPSPFFAVFPALLFPSPPPNSGEAMSSP